MCFCSIQSSLFLVVVQCRICELKWHVCIQLIEAEVLFYMICEYWWTIPSGLGVFGTFWMSLLMLLRALDLAQVWASANAKFPSYSKVWNTILKPKINSVFIKLPTNGIFWFVFPRVSRTFLRSMFFLTSYKFS